MSPRFIGKVIERDRTRGRAQRIARGLRTERVVRVFEEIFAEARNERRVSVR
jgi:hypothetical protein